MNARSLNIIFRITVAAIVLLMGCATTRQWKIKGCVMDPDARPIAGAKVKIEGPYTHSKAISGRDGQFSAEIGDRNRPSFLSVTAPGYINFAPLHLTYVSYGRYFNIYLNPTSSRQGSFGRGALSGQVIDESGGPIPGCIIIIEGASLGTTAAADGSYQIVDIPAGAYSVAAKIVGYNSSYYSPIFIKSDSTTYLNIKLLSLTITYGPDPADVALQLFNKFRTSNERKLTEDQIRHNPAAEVNNLIKAYQGLNR